MASVEDLTVKVRIESVLQKEIIDVVQNMQRDHGIVIDNIDFVWANHIDGKKEVVRVETTSSYEPV